MSELFDKFIANIRVAELSGCWEWIGSKSQQGYGKFYIRPNTFVAHRIAYLLFTGDIPEGLVIHHRCRNRACVNPEHLEAVTNGQNMRRENLGRLLTHCKYGHEFTEANSYNDKKGVLHCLTCKHEWYLKNRDRQHLRAKWRKLLRSAGKYEYDIDRFIKDVIDGRT